MFGTSPLLVSALWAFVGLPGVSPAVLEISLVFIVIASIVGIFATGLWVRRLKRQTAGIRAALATINSTSTRFRFSDTQMGILEQTEAESPNGWLEGRSAHFRREDFNSLFEYGAKDLSDDLDDLIDKGLRFSTVTRLANGTPVLVSGRPVGMTAEVEVAHPTPETETLFEEAARARELASTAAAAEARLAAVPVAMAELDDEGEPLWSNARFREITEANDLTSEMRALIASPPDRPVVWPGASELDGKRWVRANVEMGAEGQTHLTLAPAEEEVASREALRTLMNTLADTFAHLSVGLAVFGQKQSLTMFNPALATLFDLDPVALAGQPSLRAFLDALRQHRRLPEMRSFTEWRDTLLRLGQKGYPNVYMEDWTLPSGKVIGVTARHHTGGAVVFMFDDISTRIMLERRYRQEIETSQTTLDCLQDGVAVFNTAGSLIFANTAFEELWGVESMSSLGAPAIKELVDHMAARSDCLTIWNRFRSFVQSADSRTTWTADIPMLEGAPLEARFTTLPDGSAMALFHRTHPVAPAPTDLGAIYGNNCVVSYLEDRFGKSANSLIPTAVMPEGLPNDLALVSMLASLNIPGDMLQEDTGDGTVERVAVMLTSLGFDVDVSAWDELSSYEHWNVSLRQIIWCLALTAAHGAVKGTDVRLSGHLQDGWIQIAFSMTATDAIGPEQSRLSGRTLLQKLVQDLGGNVLVEPGEAPNLLHFTFGLPLYTHHSGPEVTKLRIVS